MVKKPDNDGVTYSGHPCGYDLASAEADRKKTVAEFIATRPLPSRREKRAKAAQKRAKVKAVKRMFQVKAFTGPGLSATEMRLEAEKMYRAGSITRKQALALKARIK